MIWHLDLDSFYVSAERLRHPSLRGIPVAVGGTGPRAVLSTCSYEARKFGVCSAMPTAKALKLCPQLVVQTPDHEYYTRLSRSVFSLLQSYTPVYEVVSIDEAYLDMRGTESLFGPPHVAAARLRAHIYATTGLTASIGIGANRLVAKVTTDTCKPDNLRVIAAGDETAFFAPLSIERLPGCGPVTQKWLRERGIQTLGDLQKYPRDVLTAHFGKFGDYLHNAALGRGSTEFHLESKNRSISREITFERDVADREFLESILWSMCGEMAAELRSENSAAKAV